MKFEFNDGTYRYDEKTIFRVEEGKYEGAYRPHYVEIGNHEIALQEYLQLKPKNGEKKRFTLSQDNETCIIDRVITKRGLHESHS